MSTVQIDPSGRAVHYVRSGPRGGVPVVLLHAAGLDRGYWDRQLVALHDAYDVVVPDLPGHGATPGEPRDWTLEQLTATLSGFLHALDIRVAHLAGVSLGGMLGQSLAATEPDLVRSLTLIGTTASFSADGRAAMLERARTARSGGMAALLPATIARWFTPETVARRPDLIDRVTTTLLADDPLVHAAVWEMIAGLDLAPGLGRIGCPTLVLVGTEDRSTPVAAAQELRDGIAGARLEIIPDTSHLAPLEHPGLTNTHLRSFLQGQP
ncbi:alpha/beta fold hydrolase [Kitasatospora sp. NBC_01287]|uniref:alpha/beta fold hydrolase n=1 Tax=Kitasatospora sp. NBC_01287 TaxID=2903573 RepID=UPI00225A25CD|nr:alpha/beta fold hydrolase [Kitasatospora sp. NBC_01287]MCX4745921.1 alpha/beta fold hydrolase [Kitasatospora sp. NBC_01287]